MILLAVGLALIASTPSWGAMVASRNAKWDCRTHVNAKGLKGHAWQAEMDKCKADPLNYK